MRELEARPQIAIQSADQRLLSAFVCRGIELPGSSFTGIITQSVGSLGRLQLPHLVDLRSLPWRIEVFPHLFAVFPREMLVTRLLPGAINNKVWGSGWAAATSLARVSSRSSRCAIVRISRASLP